MVDENEEVDVYSEIHGRIRSFLVDELDVTEPDADRVADVGADHATSLYHDLGYL